MDHLLNAGKPWTQSSLRTSGKLSTTEGKVRLNSTMWHGWKKQIHEHWFFFFLRCGRSRSKARSLHENKLLSRKLQHGHRWSHANWQIMTTKHKTPQPKGKTQIPQPDLRLTITRTAKQTAKGARAQQKQPQKICQGHSGENPLCRKLQNMQQTN